MLLACRNIVGYIGVGSVDTTSLLKHHVKTSCYLVQEYMDGGTLKQKIWRQVRPPAEEADYGCPQSSCLEVVFMHIPITAI